MKKSNITPLITENMKKQMALTDYLNECIALWTEQNETKRSELIVSLYVICCLVFCGDTPHDLDGQLSEIDDFHKKLIRAAKFNITL